MSGGGVGWASVAEAAAEAADGGASGWAAAAAAAEAAAASPPDGWGALAASAAASAESAEGAEAEVAVAAAADGAGSADAFGHALTPADLAPAGSVAARRKAAWHPLEHLRKRLRDAWGHRVAAGGREQPLPAAEAALAAARDAVVDEDDWALFGPSDAEELLDGDADAIAGPVPHADAEVALAAVARAPVLAPARAQARVEELAQLVEQTCAIAEANSRTERDFVAAAQRGVVQYFLDEKRTTLPFHQECSNLGVGRRRADGILRAVAAACVSVQNRDVCRMIRQLTRSILERGGRALTWSESVRYDETPMHMRLTDTEKAAAAAADSAMPAAIVPADGQPRLVPISASCSSSHVAKILNTERVFSMLYHLPDVGYVGVRVPLETPVQSLSRTTGEVLYDALKASRPPIDDDVLQQFGRRQRLVCTDGASGITRMERNFAREEAGRSSTLKVKCEVHVVFKWHACAFHHVKADTSCMVHAAKALRWQDGMRSFRAALRQELQDTLQYRCDMRPSPVDVARSTKCLDLFLSETSAHRRLRRVVILSLANGDWAKRHWVHKLAAHPPP
ncbi:unnamed protein product [Prorocentrum cordatum]|uniref:Uncharacterized protein n=1 Tax=Prorocentrum cordatum TaxID=2364126 RepID=A0ABN9S347_9DINO|nr:unnamed protein product [Polarella glacialis]CAK0826187.1 unnamed protein product [Polarella glacialis]